MQGWQADPFGLHEKRYFSSGQPTKLVRDGDAESYDEPPVEESTPPAEAIDAAAVRGIDAIETGVTEATAASAEDPAADNGPADGPAGGGAPSAVVAIVADAVGKADDKAASGADFETAPAEAPAATERVPRDEAEGGAAAEGSAAADSAVTETDQDLAGSGLSVPGLDVLRRRPRGLVYATVTVAAVAVVIAIIAITGGFGPHPQAGTFGALAQSGSSTGSATAPLDTAAAAVVTASARQTLAKKTADITLSGTATGAGPALPLHGTGQVDFRSHAISASLGGTYQGGTVAEHEIATSKSAYLQLAIGGRNLFIQSTGRHWMNIPMAQGTNLSENITAYSLPWSLELLAQQPASVTSIGAKNIGGVRCTGYAVTPSKQALLTVVQQEWTYLGLSAKARGEAMQALNKGVAAPMTAWFDPHRQLACEMTVDMQLTNSATSAWSKQPTATMAQVTVDFTHYGVPVRITPPAASDSILF